MKRAYQHRCPLGCFPSPASNQPHEAMGAPEQPRFPARYNALPRCDAITLEASPIGMYRAHAVRRRLVSGWQGTPSPSGYWWSGSQAAAS
jgi:hypothetical protein